MKKRISTRQTARQRAEVIMKVSCGLMNASQAAAQLGVSRTSLPASRQPERSVGKAAGTYGLPFFSTAGCTDSKQVDVQAAVEGSIQDMVMATLGGGLVHNTHCWLAHGAILSPAHLVVGQEILALVKQFMQGIDVSPDTLAVNLIDKIGPSGNFLMDPHTMKNF